MKKKILIACLLIIVLFSLYSCSNLTIEEEYELLISNKLPVDSVMATFIYDISSLENVVGYADYVFVGKVKEYKQTNTDTLSEIPETIYSVEVVENIKGNLSINNNIDLIKSGGLTKDYKHKVIFNKDILPKVNELYIFSTFALENKEIKAEGENSTIKLENSEDYKNDTKYLNFIEAYQNQIVFDRQRYKSKYEQE